LLARFPGAAEQHRARAWWRGKKQKTLANPHFAVIINGAFCFEPTPARRAKKSRLARVTWWAFPSSEV
jgi:hypothetical protein